MNAFWVSLGLTFWAEMGGKNHDVRESRQHPIKLIGVAFFIAELGDKTMLTAAALATTHSWFPVWIETTVGMVCSDGLAVWLGLGRRL